MSVCVVSVTATQAQRFDSGAFSQHDEWKAKLNKGCLTSHGNVWHRNRERVREVCVATNQTQRYTAIH